MSKAAIVVGGAVAKGAFAAGALSVLMKHFDRNGIDVVRLVGTSSGALNAVFMAAAIRRGSLGEAPESLVELWEEKASALHFLHLDPEAAVMGKGFSSMNDVVDLLKSTVPTSTSNQGRAAVSVRVVVAPLSGRPLHHPGAGSGHTTFEAVEELKDDGFEDDSKRAHMFEAAAASATFPILFKPTDVEGLGPCFDGGLVNNTPIGEALEGIDDLDEVYVISAEPGNMMLTDEESSKLSWVSLAQRAIEIMIYERLCRDLKEARRRNVVIESIEQLRVVNGFTEEQVEAVKAALGWKRYRKLNLIEIRPAGPLPGGPVDGFLRDDLRKTYVRLGREAAEHHLQTIKQKASSAHPAHRGAPLSPSSERTLED
jgi:predicted acylesterase/phospholipase RssA